MNRLSSSKTSFTHTVNVAVFMSGTFDLFNVMCKQHHTTALNPFLNGTKNGDINGTCKWTFINGTWICIFSLIGRYT